MERRYDEIAELLSQPEIASDPEQLQKLGREQAKLEETVATYRELRSIESQIEENRELLDEAKGDHELQELIREELGTLGARKESVEKSFRIC